MYPAESVPGGKELFRVAWLRERVDRVIPSGKRKSHRRACEACKVTRVEIVRILPPALGARCIEREMERGIVIVIAI